VIHEELAPRALNFVKSGRRRGSLSRAEVLGRCPFRGRSCANPMWGLDWQSLRILKSQLFLVTPTLIDSIASLNFAGFSTVVADLRQ
jgi:hypothetical protein